MSTRKGPEDALSVPGGAAPEWFGAGPLDPFVEALDLFGAPAAPSAASAPAAAPTPPAGLGVPEHPEEDTALRIAMDLFRRVHTVAPEARGLPATPEAMPDGPSPHLPTTDAAVRDLVAAAMNPSLPAETVTEPAPSFYFLPEERPSPEAPPAEGFDVAAVRRQFPALHQDVHGKPLVWFDNAATTQKPRCVIDSLARHYAKDNSNIHRGAHTLAARATQAYESAREVVRRFLGAGAVEEIVFVRGTTEAINLVAQAWGRKHVGPGDEILLTRLEHHANIVPWQMLANEKGAVLRVVPITDRGEPILEEYQRLLSPRTRIAAFTHVSNALGTVLPVKEMAAMAHRQGVPVLVDGAQSVPHLRANVQEIGADFFVFSGHKVYGPTGVGVLYARKEILDEMPPWQGGGNMIRTVTFERTTYAEPPAKFEAGTPTIADAVGLGTAIEFLERLGVENVARYEHGLLEYGTGRLQEVPGLRLIGTAPEKASVLSFVLEGARTEDVGRYLDSEGIAVRAGHHCAQPTMQHYGLDGTVRPSLALYNTRDEVDRLVEALLRFRHA